MGKKTGNLIKNGSFELGLVAWQSENVVASKGSSHTGTSRAVMGSANQLPSCLSQDIKVERKHYYMLSLFACASGTSGDLNLKLTWLDKRGTEIGTGLNFEISGKCLTPHPFWTYYLDPTCKAPDECKIARLSISKEPGGMVNLDDIMFYLR